RNRIPFVGVDPNILLAIKENAITALKNGVSDDDVAQAEGVGGKGRITAGWTCEIALLVELGLPQCSARSVNDEEIAMAIEGQPVGNQVLAAGGRQGKSAAQNGDGCWRDNPGLPSYAVSWHIAAERRAIAHRLNTKYFCTVHQARGGTVSAWAGYF